MNTERPNILFLLTDMQRYDALGFNGNAVCKTPAIDRIAQRGDAFLPGLYAHCPLLSRTRVVAYRHVSAQSRADVEYGQF